MDRKIAFIFPGQGAQYVSMGRDFYDNCMASRRIYERADETIDVSITDICFLENEKIDITEYTQAALLTTEAAMLAAVRERGIECSVAAGLSLGEYAALIATGAISEEDAIYAVRKRGIYMQEEVPASVGAMAAVLSMDQQSIESIIENIDKVCIANYNCPGQIVISGEREAVTYAASELKKAGAKRCVMLNVSGPFHSPLLRGAGDKLYKELENINIGELRIPYVCNLTGDYVYDNSEIRELLKKQVYSSVRWEQSVRKMIDNGVNTFIEIGPGKTLSSFVKKINRDVEIMNIEKYEDIDKVCERLGEAVVC